MTTEKDNYDLEIGEYVTFNSESNYFGKFNGKTKGKIVGRITNPQRS